MGVNLKLNALILMLLKRALDILELKVQLVVPLEISILNVVYLLKHK